MKTTINQRVKEIADKLCGGNVSELARVVGVAQPALRDIVGTKQAKPRFEIINQIVECSTLQINADWLITGKGPMQRHTVNILHNPTYRDVGQGAIPIYDINAAANLNTLFDNDKQHLLGEIMIPKAPACDGAIYVRGDSMFPIVNNGDMVAYKKVNNIDYLRSNMMYLVDCQIEGDDFLVVKYLKWEEKNVTLRLISHNKIHEDMLIPASAVRAVALVKIVVSIYEMI